MPSTTVQPAATPEITITSAGGGNPLIVEGRARTFENNVVVRVRDARGRLIRETFTTSRGEMGQHNPYRAEVFITRDPGGKLIVEALEYSARDGSERSLVARTVDYDVDLIEATLYLPETNPTDCSRVHPEQQSMPKSVSMARLLVEALIDHPRSPFPKGSAVDSIALRDGVLTVDFNHRLQNVGGSCAALAIRAAVEQTLKALPSIQRVVITAGGSEKLALQP
ncbi:MAG TPA: Gmad2 immunoglobulin-like domain-containing protein [Thermoanaerobaculia bacterium]|nr:Gmad2 immunoglobulin-like domain-containing protein [Thermoanaerobaculia bacterium]